MNPIEWLIYAGACEVLTRSPRVWSGFTAAYHVATMVESRS